VVGFPSRVSPSRIHYLTMNYHAP